MSIELKGKKCYVTGRIEDYTKRELRKILERKGMIWSKRINGELDYLITGEEPGEKKIAIAEEINIKIIPWSEFRNYLS